MRTSSLVAGLALVGCHGKGDGAPLPAAGALEPVEIIWEGAAFPAAHPSVTRFDSAWHLYFTSLEGSIEATFHARSDDGLSFDLLSSHRVLDDLATSGSDLVSASVAYSSGSRVHLLANASRSGADEIWHATATDGDTFTLDGAATFSGDGLQVTGALYEATEVLGAFHDRDSSDAPEVLIARSTDGGASFPDPAPGLGPDDLPTPWGSSTVGAGGMWGATIAPDPEGGYHMLYLGAGPNGDEAIGIGQAWSGDGEVWTADGEIWYAPEEGVTLNGLSLVLHEDRWWLWVGSTTDGAAPLEAGTLSLMMIE